MGANMCFAAFNACPEKQLRDQFRSYQQSARFEHGHDTYGGHMGLAQGLQILQRSFSDKTAAIDFIHEQSEKGGPALAVKIGAFDKLYPHTSGEMQLEKTYTELKTLSDGWDEHLLKQAKAAKSKVRGCAKCGSKIALKYLTTVSCPVCMNTKFLHTETEMKKYASLQKRLTALSLKRERIMAKYNEKNKDKNFWFVGACVRS